jgi:histidine triad (HIT) family protein
MADCLFCQIVDGTIPADIIRRDDEVIAFRDISPQAPHHVLIIPTRHLEAARDAQGSAGEQLLGRLVKVATEVASELGLDEAGYRLVTNTGVDGGQAVFHLHLHLLGGRAMAWPPG